VFGEVTVDVLVDGAARLVCADVQLGLETLSALRVRARREEAEDEERKKDSFHNRVWLRINSA